VCYGSKAARFVLGRPLSSPAVTFSLASLFQELNERFFGGRLPRYRVVFSSSQRTSYQAGAIRPEKRLIQVNRIYASSLERVRRILLHEMCHHRSVGHGKGWQSEMLRLASMGETWAKEEIQAYRGWSRGKVMKRLRKRITDVVADYAGRGLPVRFQTVVRLLAPEFGKSPSELVRLAPWLGSAYRNEVKAHGPGPSRIPKRPRAN